MVSMSRPFVGSSSSRMSGLPEQRLRRALQADRDGGAGILLANGQRQAVVGSPQEFLQPTVFDLVWNRLHPRREHVRLISRELRPIPPEPQGIFASARSETNTPHNSPSASKRRYSTWRGSTTRVVCILGIPSRGPGIRLSQSYSPYRPFPPARYHFAYYRTANG